MPGTKATSKAALDELRSLRPHSLCFWRHHDYRGWQTVRRTLQKAYDTREKMGQLTFSDLEFTILSKDAAVVAGYARRSIKNVQKMNHTDQASR